MAGFIVNRSHPRGNGVRTETVWSGATEEEAARALSFHERRHATLSPGDRSVTFGVEPA